MDPHVYPEGLNPPLRLVKGTNSTAGIEQLTTVVGSDKTMFIRVAMSSINCTALAGPTAPILSLQANTGDFVPLITTTKPIYKLPGTSLSDYIGDAKVEVDPSFNNVYKITVTFFDSAGSYTWSLRIQNQDGAAGEERDFTWVVSGAEANTVQPWIDVDPATLTFNVLTNSAVGLPTQVRNKGTGSLTVASVLPALPGGSGLSLGALPAAINPGLKESLTVTLANAPGAPGIVSATETIRSGTGDDALASASPGHNHQLSITAKTQEVEVIILLDDSGSMSWDPLGNTIPPSASPSRWSELVSAVNPFLNLLAQFGNTRGRYGIARFPATNASNPSTFDIITPTAIPDMVGIGAAQTAVSAITPFFAGTPMGDGIDRVFAPATSFFKTDATSINTNRRWLLLMTDGAHNAGVHNPLEFILPPVGTAAAGTSLLDKKVHLFAIGYGVTGHSDVNPTLLSQLAAGSFEGGGIRRPDDAGLTALQIASAFRDAIKAGITPSSSPGDPRGVFHGGQGEARHEATITHYDGKTAFVLHWTTPDEKRMRLELLTPNCELITPENAGKGDYKGVTMRGGDRFQMYMVSEDFVHNRADPSQPRYGTWTLVITSPELSDSRGRSSEIYEYDIIVESNLRMDLSLDRAVYYAGDPIKVSAQLTADGKPITGAAVTLSTTAPGQSVANWLSGLAVPAEAMAKAAEILKDQDSTPLLVKMRAAEIADFSFDARKRQSQQAMTDPGEAGIYQTEIANTSTPELYTFYVTATGITEDGVIFRREGKLAINVLVRPDPGFTLVDIRFLQAGMAEVSIIPRDRFGNVLLVDPATTTNFELVTRGAKAGPLTSNLDGSYTRQLKFSPEAAPVINVKFDGQVIKQKTLPKVGKLIWVDRLIQFRPGAEAVKGANQHLRPEAALGSFFDKKEDAFVSLGANGALIVSVSDQVILPAGEADVTVIVEPESEGRAYRVEAYVPRDLFAELRSAKKPKFGWVLLGESAGDTASFSLKRAGIPHAAAIRITDTSGQTRDKTLRPLNRPGVSIRAVGVTKASKTCPWNMDWLHKFLQEEAEK